jgi:mannosyltransferase OCH1-like enzyme
MNIPKIVHQIWFNFTKNKKGDKMPIKYIKEREKIIKKNMDFTFILWSEKNAKKLIKRKYKWFYKKYTQFKNPVERVDAFKYILMYEYGGIYIDTDVKVKKGFSKFFEKHNINNNIILSEESRPILKILSFSNSILISKKSEKFWIHVLKYINKWESLIIENIDPHLEIICKTGPIMLHSVYTDFLNKYRITIVPSVYFMEKSIQSCIYHISDKTWCANSDILYSITKMCVYIFITVIVLKKICKFLV